jgi:tRNA (cytidine/uridine-2'-O-)-methyltransferase
MLPARAWPAHRSTANAPSPANKEVGRRANEVSKRFGQPYVPAHLPVKLASCYQPVLVQTPARLRAKPLAPPLHVVLVEPEIPPNTGNIGRLTAATASVLHLVGRLGFRIDDRAVKRAGLDYWHLVDLRTHVDFPHFAHAFAKESPNGKLHLFSAQADKSYLSGGFAPGDALVFGKESVGLSETLLAQYEDRVLGIPTLGAVRSLNLSNAVSIVVYEALRQLGALDATYMG